MSFRRWIFAVFLLLILIGVGWYGFKRWNSRGYVAVFLTNNQVYFGAIAWESRRDLLLREVYYIQPKEIPGSPQIANTDLGLIKLGSEVHGPEGEMRINRDHILFVERLKPESKLLKAIQAYQPMTP